MLRAPPSANMHPRFIPPNRPAALREPPTSRKPKQERRRHERFPMALPLRYSFAASSGWGRIVNIGSGGALFTVDQPVKSGEWVDLCIGWPVLLHGRVHLNLIAKGPILRVEGGCAAARIERFSFRTASSESRRPTLLPESASGAEPQV